MLFIIWPETSEKHIKVVCRGLFPLLPRLIQRSMYNCLTIHHIPTIMSEILPRLSEDNQNDDMAVSADIRDARMSAVQRDILSTSADSKGDAVASGEWFIFDVTVMSMALHHIASPEDAVRLLVERLRSGRIVRLIDWVLDLVKFHGADLSKSLNMPTMCGPQCVARL